jgi:hypothetical protein
MTIRADKIAFRYFHKEVGLALSSRNTRSDTEQLLATYMIEVHTLRWKLPTAVHARRVFQRLHKSSLFCTSVLILTPVLTVECLSILFVLEGHKPYYYTLHQPGDSSDRVIIPCLA